MREKVSSLVPAVALLLAAALQAVPGPAYGDDEAERIKLRDMVLHQIQGRGVRDRKVIRAMLAVPRQLYVPAPLRGQAYRDSPLPIGHGQTISQPYVVALMTEALELSEDDKVLEIGTGSGYQAAVLAEIAKRVCSIEIIPELAAGARRNLDETGYGRVLVKTGDGYFGWPEEGPFDAIIITAAANHVPPPLIEQLRVGGRLILPLGRTEYVQTLTLLTKKEDRIEILQMGGVRFVPMVGPAQKPAPAAAAPK